MFVFVLVIILLLAAYAALILYYTTGWKAMPLYDHTKQLSQPRQIKISVIIPARNEAANIARCIDSLSKQTYSKKKFEIIIVDDQSTDDTWNIINHIHYEELALVCIKSAEPVNDPGTGKAYKKMAIETGIHAADGELIVTTDADCTFTKNWLQTIASFYVDRQAKFIAAPVKIENGFAFLSVFQTLDFITLQGITGASVFKKIHSMCNGANLAYEKKAFLEVGGFRGIDHIPSGDDMLLMHKIYKKFPDQVFFLKSKQAIVSTRDEKSWKGFINQRIRWASKADQYDDKRIFWVLLMVYLLNFLMCCLFFAVFLHSFFLWVLLMLLLAKTCIEYPFVRSAASFFDQQGLMVYFPFLQPFHIVYTVVIGWLGKFGNYTWKERKVK